MKTVKVGGEYCRQYEDTDTYWMDGRWKRWLESYIHRECRWVRWGIDARDGQMTWQVVVLAMLLAWLIVLIFAKS